MKTSESKYTKEQLEKIKFEWYHKGCRDGEERIQRKLQECLGLEKLIGKEFDVLR